MSYLQTVFYYLKNLFIRVDESARKRRASEAFIETENLSPKKHCNHHCYDMSKTTYIDLEDDDNVEIISEYISPNVSRRVDASQLKNTPTYANSENCMAIFTKHNLNKSQLDPRTPLGSGLYIQKPSTLRRANFLQEKKKYGQMIQNFLPSKQSVVHQVPEKQPVQEVEIIELSQTPETSPQLSRKSTVSLDSLLPSRWSISGSFKKDSVEDTKFKKDVLTRQPVMTVKLDNDEQSRSTKSLSSQDVIIVKMNTLQEKLADKAVIQGDFLKRMKKKYTERKEQRDKYAEELRNITNVLAKQNQITREANLSEQLARSMRLCEPFLDEREEPEEPELPTLTSDMLNEVKAALTPRSPEEVLVDNFGLRILKRDIHTLANLNWLNDEVINFYMNLLIERGKQDKFPNIHAMNTFFYPKLVQSGHASLKRWTRKVDIFAQDIIVVPVHLGIHWCMSIIDFRDKSIRYYDSMGSDNVKCLNALQKYLEDESLDKKKKPYDTSDWTLECVKKIPQQMNGSDCGVFSCMFAEYICANKRITFTQEDMPYFRQKMVYEILHSKLL